MMAIFFMPHQRRKGALVPAVRLDPAFDGMDSMPPKAAIRLQFLQENLVGTAGRLGPGRVACDAQLTGSLPPSRFPFSGFGPTCSAPELEQQPS